MGNNMEWKEEKKTSRSNFHYKYFISAALITDNYSGFI